MRVIAVLIVLSLVFPVFGDPSPAPPQLLGVWYGTYDATPGDDRTEAEMWMEISYQLENGLDIRGHNRWNIQDEASETAHGAKSLGKNAEYYDSFTGHIAPDGKSVTIEEDQRGGRLEARIAGADTLDARFYAPGESKAVFRVALKRVDTHYSPTDINVRGIDVSHHSGAVDWKRVRDQGFRFAYVKASEGVDNPDAMFETHWKALGELGMARGAYHFYVTEDDPIEQAKFFASRIREDLGTLPPAVDVETLGANTKGDMTETLLTFLKTLEKEIGLEPVIYTSSRFWNEHFRPEFADYPLWMAEYGVAMPKVPFGWKNWLFWQHAEDRPVDGVEKSADISMIHPSIDLKSLQSKR